MSRRGLQKHPTGTQATFAAASCVGLIPGPRAGDAIEVGVGKAAIRSAASDTARRMSRRARTGI
jgi:hypothetical protein